RRRAEKVANLRDDEERQQPEADDREEVGREVEPVRHPPDAVGEENPSKLADGDDERKAPLGLCRLRRICGKSPKKGDDKRTKALHEEIPRIAEGADGIARAPAGLGSHDECAKTEDRKAVESRQDEEHLF